LPINACIALVALLDGCHLVTVEAIAQDSLSPVQQAIVDHHGSQCGYCTPGFVMAMTGIFEKPRPRLTEQKIKNCLTGNLCRCTGYQPLIAAARAVEWQKMEPLSTRFVDETAERELLDAAKMPVHIVHGQQEFFAPLAIDDAIALRMEKPDVRIIAGASDLGVMQNKGRMKAGRLLSLQLIRELSAMRESDGRIHVGAAVSLSDVRNFVKKSVPVFADFLNIFASPQIKNVATLVGNVANGSPIADTIPFLMVCDGMVHVEGREGQRSIAVDKLFQGYKKLALDPSEIITHISFRKPAVSELLRLEKVSTRKDLDIATVNLAMLFDLDENRRVMAARIAIGGSSAVVLRMKSAETALIGNPLTDAAIDEAAALIAEDLSPQSDLRGTADYRRMLIDGLFRRFCGVARA
jgi:xanthine dehydrogenase small subunit